MVKQITVRFFIKYCFICIFLIPTSFSGAASDGISQTIAPLDEATQFAAIRRPIAKMSELQRLEGERQAMAQQLPVNGQSSDYWSKRRLIDDQIAQLRREISDWRLDRFSRLDKIIAQATVDTAAQVEALYRQEPPTDQQADALQWGFRLMRLHSPLATEIYKSILQANADRNAVTAALNYFFSQPATTSVAPLLDFLQNGPLENSQIIDVIGYLKKNAAFSQPALDLLASKYADHDDPYVAQSAIQPLLEKHYPNTAALADRLLRRPTTRKLPALRVVLIGRLPLEENIQLFGDMMTEMPTSTAGLSLLEQPQWPVSLAIARKINAVGGNADLVAPLVYAVASMKNWPYAEDIFSRGYHEPIFPELFNALAASSIRLQQQVSSNDRCPTASTTTTTVYRLPSAKLPSTDENQCKLLRVAGEILAFHLRSFIYALSATNIDDPNGNFYGQRERVDYLLKEMASRLIGKGQDNAPLPPFEYLPRRLLADLVTQAKEQEPAELLAAGLRQAETLHGAYLEKNQPLLLALGDCRRPYDYYELTKAVHRNSPSVDTSATVLGDVRMLRLQVCVGDNVHHYVTEFLLALGVVPISGRPEKAGYAFHANATDANDYIEGVIWAHPEIDGQSPLVEVPQVGVYLPTDTKNQLFLPLGEIVHSVSFANHYYGPHRLLMAMARSLIRMMSTTAAIYIEQDLVQAPALYELAMPSDLVTLAKKSRGLTDRADEAVTLAGSGVAIDTPYVVAGLADYEKVWQDSFDRHQQGHTRTARSVEEAIRRLLSQDYLPLLQSLPNDCTNCSSREYATVLWRSRIANDEDDAAKLLLNNLKSIDLFGGAATEDTWRAIAQAYFELPMEQRDVEHIYPKVVRNLKYMLLERALDKVKKLHAAIIKIAEVDSTDEMLTLVGGPPELLVGISTELATQPLLGHYETFYQQYLEQDRIDKNNLIIRGLIEGGITVLLIPVGGAFFQAIKLSARAATAVEAIGSATRLTEALEVGSSISRSSIPTLSRIAASSGRLAWSVARNTALTLGRRSVVTAGFGAYALMRPDLADAVEKSSMHEAMYETNVSETMPWRHERPGFGDEQCFLLTTATYERLQAACEMRQNTDWAVVGLSVIFSAEMPLLRSIGQRPLSWMEYLIVGSTTLGSYPAIRSVAIRAYQSTQATPSTERPNFFENTPENRLIEIYKEAASLNVSPEKVLQNISIRRAIEEIEATKR